MIYSNVDFNVVYVDPSIETPGDGTTPAGALKALPASAADFTDKTCYLIRRTTEDSAVVIPNGENTKHQHHKFAASRDAESLRSDV